MRDGNPGRPERRIKLRLRFFSAYLFVLFSIFLSCDKGKEGVPSSVSGDIPDEEVMGFSVTETTSGRKEWILRAKWAGVYNDKGITVARTVAIEFFDETGKKYSDLTSREGILEHGSSDMRAKGDVVVVTDEGTKLETDELVWLNGPGKIVSDGFVKITRKKDIITGIGFESHPDLKEFEIKKDIKGELIGQKALEKK